jgi:hypothetical protein
MSPIIAPNIASIEYVKSRASMQTRTIRYYIDNDVRINNYKIVINSLDTK